ncbi:MAG: hypothetical protein KJP07_23675 [Desulfatitalea sp.]|nr:hypothetical protein [Desulfatitalea sp.]
MSQTDTVSDIGIYPGLGGRLRMARHVGPELTQYNVFAGAMMDAATAFELGIVTEIIDRQAQLSIEEAMPLN